MSMPAILGATDVYTEAEYAYGSIDWGAASAPLTPGATPTRPGDPPGAADRSSTLTPRAVPLKRAKGTNLLAARLTLNDHGVQTGCRVYSAGIEVENLSGRAATVHFDPKDLQLELLRIHLRLENRLQVWNPLEVEEYLAVYKAVTVVVLVEVPCGHVA